MAASHHGDGQLPKDLVERFIAQVEGKAKRQWSSGRIAPEDEGDLVMAVTTDKVHKTVVVRFGKPVEWIGLREKEVKGLIQVLLAKLREIATEPFTLEV